MSPNAIKWRVLRDRGPLEIPGPGDVLTTIVATDKTEATTIAERLFAEPVVVVVASQWPQAPAEHRTRQFYPERT